MPNGQDPDDYIKLNEKENFLKLLEQKKIIQSYIWDLYSNNINRNDPYAISKFEKDIKKLCYTIKDETLKKYIMEDFLNRIKEFTPIQNFKYKKNFIAKKDFKILNATKQLHKERNKFSKEELLEFSIIYTLLNFSEISQSNVKKLSNINFSNNQVNDLKEEIIKVQSNNKNISKIKEIINKKFDTKILEIEKNSNLKNIISNKSDLEKEELFVELLEDLKEVNQLKEIDYLEKKFAKNLDESSYSELIKLKSQLNRR